ncbi:hypothetical protein [Aeromonas rivuli]|uniref:hypothetical protein n=1 Tax=Aeromonas rivuli TaxID=648794 RepID=UPI001CCFDB12|nr:hypothetical protein [Aeromonas rivuli]UBO73454.1 hypothetical protein KYK33_16785 [Aeromonas rivuli]
MKKWFIPLLALWLFACSSGPGVDEIERQVRAQLLTGSDAKLFDMSDFQVLDQSETQDGVYLIKVSYQLHFKQGLDQLQVLQDEDLVYDRVGPYQQEMALMELERKYGNFEAGQVVAQQSQVWMLKTEQGWRLAEPA